MRCTWGGLLLLATWTLACGSGAVDHPELAGDAGLIGADRILPVERDLEPALDLQPARDLATGPELGPGDGGEQPPADTGFPREDAVIVEDLAVDSGRATPDLGPVPDSGPAPELAIWFQPPAPAWPSAFLHFSAAGGPWTAAPGQAMQAAVDGWWQATVPPTPDLEFVFNDGADRWYPGGQGNNFRTSWPTVYVRDGLIYTADPAGDRPPDELVVLTLNLHTYQEADARAKLDRVADVIARLRPDFVCLQECAQHRGALVVEEPHAAALFPGEPIREDNMARLITARLAEVHGQSYQFVWSWAHYGWDVWEEGVALLTPHRVLDQASRYISTGTGRNTIDSRKAVWLAVEPRAGVRWHGVSTHTSWGGDQAPQFRTLKAWVAEQDAAGQPAASVIGGDFNAPAGQAGWALLTSAEEGRWVDSYLQANPRGLGDATMPGERTRIDYLFTPASSGLSVRTSQIYFKDPAVLGGRVSDHYGVVTRFQLPEE